MTLKQVFSMLKSNKHSRSFSLFILVGILKAVISVLLSWILIDVMKISALIASTFIVVSVFLFIYFLYVRLKVIKPKFLKYLGATFLFNILNIVFVWIFVDFLHFSGAFSSFIVICSLFFLRYLFLDKIGIIRYY